MGACPRPRPPTCACWRRPRSARSSASPSTRSWRSWSERPPAGPPRRLPRAVARRGGERRRVPRRAGRRGPAHGAVAPVERGQLPRAVGHRRRPQPGLSAGTRRIPRAVRRASRRSTADPRDRGERHDPMAGDRRRRGAGIPARAARGPGGRRRLDRSCRSAPARSMRCTATATRRRTRSRSDEAERHPLREG